MSGGITIAREKGQKAKLAQGLEQGLVQIYTGNGKGKTTAAMGLAVRAAGQGLRVSIIQFMKSGNNSGEINSFAQLPNININTYGGQGFVFKTGVKEEDMEQAKAGFTQAKQLMQNNECDLLILDEINNAIQYKLIELKDILTLIEDKPPNMELVLTGRDVPQEMVDKAQLVTEMKEIKHPYNLGIKSRAGIEY